MFAVALKHLLEQMVAQLEWRTAEVSFCRVGSHGSCGALPLTRTKVLVIATVQPYLVEFLNTYLDTQSPDA